MSQHLFSLPERNNIDDSFFSDFRAKYYKSNIPIVIDNGSHYCRVGWADEDLARLQFRPQVAKMKGKRENEPPSILVGNDIREADIHKLNPRSPFDQNVVYHFDTMEHILDHSFQRLGIDTQSISNPILMTETLCNPSYCRSAMNELLFECYGAPGVCYGVDSLFSFYANRIPSTPTIDPFTNSLADLTRASAPSPPPFSATTGIVISSSNSATHVYPVINNQWIPGKCKRLGVGGITATEYLRKLIHLKYPLHRNVITAVRAQYLKEDHSYIASNYAEELEKYRNPKPKDIHTIQLPFVPQVAAPKVDQERKLQVRKEQGQRLKEINDKKRQEKRAEQEERLACLLEIKGMQSGDTDEFVSALEGEGLNGEEELNATITDLEESLGKPLSIPQLPDDQMYPLLDVSDDQLNDEELKEKKKQKMLKSMRDGRVAAKKKRDEIQDKEKQLEKIEDDKYNQNPQQYLANLQERKQDILNRREQRQKQAAAGTGRRSRGRTNIKMLAMRDADDSKKSGKRKLEDTFGANEEDWDVYLDNQEVVREEEDQLLNQIEALLAKYDPDYVTPGDSESGNGNGDEESLYQIHLGVERIRITETVFQPQAILGMEQMGLIEIIQSILATFDEQTQQDLVQNIFFTGGNTTYDNFEKRLTNELTMLRPFQSKFQVRSANDPMNDAWLGMAKWFQNSPEEFKKAVVTKAEYEERGASYFKPYFASNVPY